MLNHETMHKHMGIAGCRLKFNLNIDTQNLYTVLNFIT